MYMVIMFIICCTVLNDYSNFKKNVIMMILYQWSVDTDTINLLIQIYLSLF